MCRSAVAAVAWAGGGLGGAAERPGAPPDERRGRPAAVAPGSAEHLRRPVRRRAVRCRDPRPSPLLRPQPGRPAGERALVRRLPHGDGPLPALARQRRAAVPVPPVAPSIRSACRRSALPADRRRRLPDERRGRQRLQQPAPERPDPDHLRPAAEREAHRSRDEPAVRGDVRGRVASGAHGQRREAHRARRAEPLATGPESDRWIPAGCARGERCRSRPWVR